MRFLRVVLALVFGLAVAGPETHACPVHNAAPAHHQDGTAHHKAAHCTCPQACCPAGVGVSLPTPAPTPTVVPSPVLVVEVAPAHFVYLPSRLHLLPFALAPPHALA